MSNYTFVKIIKLFPDLLHTMYCFKVAWLIKCFFVQQKNVAFNMAISELSADTKTKRHLMRRRQAFTGSHMTNVEIANWIDRRSRAIFPIAFIIFNLLFWSLMFT